MFTDKEINKAFYQINYFNHFDDKKNNCNKNFIHNA